MEGMVSRVARTKINQKGAWEKIISELPKKILREKKWPKRKNNNDQINWPMGDRFIPSMKSWNEIFWMVHWWVLVIQANKH
jgi:hypothetical protein